MAREMVDCLRQAGAFLPRTLDGRHVVDQTATGDLRRSSRAAALVFAQCDRGAMATVGRALAKRRGLSAGGGRVETTSAESADVSPAIVMPLNDGLVVATASPRNPSRRH
jgi:hypothetical protein